MWLSFQIDIYLLFTFQIIEMFIDHKKKKRMNEVEKLSNRGNIVSVNIIKHHREGQVVFLSSSFIFVDQSLKYPISHLLHKVFVIRNMVLVIDKYVSVDEMRLSCHSFDLVLI